MLHGRDTHPSHFVGKGPFNKIIQRLFLITASALALASCGSSGAATQDASAGKGDMAAGTVHFHAAGRHSLANVGSTPAEFVVFERLTAPLPTAATNNGKDTTASIPEQGTFMSEKPSFRVLQIDHVPASAPARMGDFAQFDLTPGFVPVPAL